MPTSSRRRALLHVLPGLALLAFAQPAFSQQDGAQPGPSQQDQAPIHLNLGAQPDAIVLLEAGAQPRPLRTPGSQRVAAQPASAILTIDTTRARTLGDGSDDTMLSRSVQYVEFVLEPQASDPERPELTRYRLVIRQASLDQLLMPGLDLGSGDAISTAIIDASPMPFWHQAPEPNSGVQRTILPTMGIGITLSIAPQGWIDAINFDYPDDATSEALTLMQDIASALRTLLPPLPTQPAGEGARWQFSQYEGIDGMLLGATRTITLAKAPPQGALADFGVMTLTQSFAADVSEGLASPATLAFIDSDVQSVHASLAGTAQSSFDYAIDATPLPREATSTLLRRSESRWTRPGEANPVTFTAGNLERCSSTLRRTTEALPPFAEPPEADAPPMPALADAARWRAVEVGAAQTFEAAQKGITFVDARLRSLLASGEPAPEASAGEGEPIALRSTLAPGQRLRAQASYERIEQMESVLPTIDAITALGVQAKLEVVLESVNEDASQATGYVLVSEVAGSESVARPAPGQAVAEGDVTQTDFGEVVTKDLAGVRIPCTAFASGGVLLSHLDVPTEVSESWDEMTMDVLFALEEVLQGMQPTRHASELRAGEVRVSSTGKPEPETEGSLTLLALSLADAVEPAQPRDRPLVLREFQFIRQAPRERDLFSVAPFIKDASVRAASRFEVAAQLSGFCVPTLASRTHSEVREATYDRAGEQTNARKTILQFMRIELLP